MEDPQSKSRSTGWSKVGLGVLVALLLLITALWLGLARLPHKVGSFAGVSGGSRMTRLEPNDPTATFRMKITDTRTGQTWDEAWSVGQVNGALTVSAGRVETIEVFGRTFSVSDRRSTITLVPGRNLTTEQEGFSYQIIWVNPL